MVSTHTQYITDFVPTSSDGKSPLAMLAKTCETIGLPDVSSKKSPVGERKNSTPENRKHENSAEKKKERSPRATPTTSKAEPATSTTFPGLPKPSFPMGGYHPGFPFYPGMMSFPMSPFPQFPMHPFMRAPCPSAMLRQPCVTPGCTSCPPADMMSQFAANPLFSAYAAMMPNVSSSPAVSSYQSLLAASAASAAAAAAATSPKHTCSWSDVSGPCGKQFVSSEELSSHIKAVHVPSPPSTTSTPDKTPSRSGSLPRFHPYAKPSMPTLQMSPMTPFNPMALQAMYAQRMMSMPHP